MGGFLILTTQYTVKIHVVKLLESKGIKVLPNETPLRLSESLTYTSQNVSYAEVISQIY